MEYTGTTAQSNFMDGIYELLISTGLVKEGKHYETEGHNKLWNNKLHDVISDAGHMILAAIDE